MLGMGCCCLLVSPFIPCFCLLLLLNHLFLSSGVEAVVFLLLVFSSFVDFIVTIALSHSPLFITASFDIQCIQCQYSSGHCGVMLLMRAIQC